MANRFRPRTQPMQGEGTTAPSGDIALFVDWENLKYSLMNNGEQPNISALLDGLDSSPSIPDGRLVISRAYADWSDANMRSDQRALYETSVEPVFVPCFTYAEGHRKNSVDVKVAVDCMDVSYSNDNISTYILISGDADFLHIANSLRSRGKRVVMIGVSGATSSRITAQRVDDLFYYDDFVDDRQNASRASTIRKISSVEDYMAVVVRILQEERRRGNSYPVLLSYLGLRLKREAPGAAPQDFGYEKLKHFLKVMESAGHLQISTVGIRDWANLPGDPTRPPEAPSDNGELREETIHVSNLLTDYEQVAKDIVLTLDELMKSRPFVALGLLQSSLYKKANEPLTVPAHASPASEQLQGITTDLIEQAVNAALDLEVILRNDSDEPWQPRWVLGLNNDNPFVTEALAERAGT